jgi:hypothetical protein
MVRLIDFTLTLVVAIGISAAGAQTNDQPNSKVQSMTGLVKTVSSSSLTLTLERSGNEVRFAVNRSTRVFAKGKAAAINDLVYRSPGPPLTDFVKVGDQVTVGYRLDGISLIAVEVRVTKK